MHCGVVVNGVKGESTLLKSRKFADLRLSFQYTYLLGVDQERSQVLSCLMGPLLYFECLIERWNEGQHQHDQKKDMVHYVRKKNDESQLSPQIVEISVQDDLDKEWKGVGEYFEDFDDG